MAELSMKVSVTGKVQGVGFRAWTRDRAEAHGLRGWVANRGEDTVEAVFAGDHAAIEEMLGEIRAGGPEAASVDEVETAPAEYDETGFEVRG
ncbi:acylphosphatase [Litorisediminicola beolgyonensis]|uniref:acylphosphatase n=1 Tax=Litorisediminicola beolgyonensis TaxID=1173614 RepID=A0ABW3ZLA6_9RHOB